MEDDPEKRSWGMDVVSSQVDLPEGPVRDLVREYCFGVVGVVRSSVESKLGNA